MKLLNKARMMLMTTPWCVLYMHIHMTLTNPLAFKLSNLTPSSFSCFFSWMEMPVWPHRALFYDSQFQVCTRLFHFYFIFEETKRRKLKSHAIVVVGVNRNDYDDVFISMICSAITLCFMSVTCLTCDFVYEIASWRYFY